jgi:very-short-patch-repair endonuclease
MEETMRHMLRTLAREARHSLTPAEKDLWERLRDHRCSGLHFRRQEVIGPFRLDFYCHAVKLAVEVDGSIHQVESVQRCDSERQEILEQEFGICFLRVTNEDIRRRLEKVVTQIQMLANELISYSNTPTN